MLKRNYYSLIIACALLAAVTATAASAAKPALAFGLNGMFKIVQFTDTQDGPAIDPRTVTAMGEILDDERPQFVVITGDCVDTGKCRSAEELKQAIEHIAAPMEQRKIPWAVTFGNHDRDNIAAIGVKQDEMLSLYTRYPCNLNRQSPRGVHGAGNANLLVSGSKSRTPAFNIWLVDSNAYAPAEIAGQKLGGYDWVRTSQVRWYSDTSAGLEKRYKRKIPSLMFFHIAVPEFRQLLGSGKFTGEKNEDVGNSHINGGLFAAALERGDVLGMFVGHDHVNTTVGDWFGIKLGYGGSIGYGTYGLPGNETERNRLRGGRVFEISEQNPAAFATRYVTATSLEP